MKRALGLVALAGLLMAAAPAPKSLGPEIPGPESAAQEISHTVKAGETLGDVSARAAVPRVLIIEANGLQPPYRLHAGQQLVIPRRRSHRVKAGDTVFAIAYEYAVPWAAIATANGLDPKAPLAPGKVLVIPTLSKLPEAPQPKPAAQIASNQTAPNDAPRLVRPAPGKVLRGFIARAGSGGVSGAHDGIDIAGEEGAPVRAAAPGTVLFAGPESRRYGNLVVIDHGRGWHTAYAKLQKVTVQPGQKIRPKERIGLIGHTGETARTELHFEVRQDNHAVDPEGLLPARE